MLRKLISVTVISILAFGVSARVGAAKEDEFKTFQGTWVAKPGVKIVQLEIRPDGACDWLAKIGDAQAEGAGQLKKEGDKYFVTIEFLQKAPLRVTIRWQGAVLELIDEKGNTIELTNKAAEEPQAAVQDELGRLEGTWRLIAAEQGHP